MTKEFNLILTDTEEITLLHSLDCLELSARNMKLRYAKENISMDILKDIAEIKKQIKENEEIG